MDWPKRLLAYSPLIESALEEILPKETGTHSQIWEAMRYSIIGGGKRVRPLLCLEFCRVCGGDIRAALPFACALELIHGYSLIHDDLPCMDDDDMRRGRPACHIAFGEATAMLAGDALLNLAYETLLKGSQKNLLPADRILQGGIVLAELAGHAGMIDGQTLDLEAEGKSLDIEQVTIMESLKTGALILAACKTGCIAAGATQAKLKAASEYASHIGLAFQVVDDILDMAGDENETGKRTGSDAQNAKSTYVALLGLQEAQNLADRLTQKAVQALAVFGEEGEPLRELALMLSNRSH